MTTNPIQPIKGNRDDAASRSNAPAGSPAKLAQATPYSTPKQGQGTTGRDEGSRSFRSGAADGSQSQGQSRDYDASEVLRCLDTIEENCRTVRQSLSGASRDGTRQSTERQSNESGARASRSDASEDTDASSERNRNFGNAD